MRFLAALLLTMVGSAVLCMSLPKGQLGCHIAWDASLDRLRRQEDVDSIDDLLMERYKEELLRSISAGEAQLLPTANTVNKGLLIRL